MLVFGMGLYELFISNLDMKKYMSDQRSSYRSNLLGLFTLKVKYLSLSLCSYCLMSSIFLAHCILFSLNFRKDRDG